MYCLVNKTTNHVDGWNSINNYLLDEDQIVYKIDENGQNFLDSLSPTDIPYFDGTNWWIEKSSRSNKEIDQDVEDMILLLAEILGTDNTEESDE